MAQSELLAYQGRQGVARPTPESSTRPYLPVLIRTWIATSTHRVLAMSSTLPFTSQINVRYLP